MTADLTELRAAKAVIAAPALIGRRRVPNSVTLSDPAAGRALFSKDYRLRVSFF